MPDIDSEWGVDPELNNNNYLDVSPPELPDNPSGGGDVNVNVTVDITRPQVPAVTTDSTWLDIDVASTTATETFPVYLDTSKNIIWDTVDSMFSNTSYITILVLIGFCGIAISVLFKGV